MASISTRTHSNTEAHGFLNRMVANFDANASALVGYTHAKLRRPNLPATIITNVLARKLEDDDTLLPQFLGGVAHPAIVAAIALEIANELEDLNGPNGLGPDHGEIVRHVGRLIADNNYLRLTREDRFELLRMSKANAKAACLNKIEAAKVKERREKAANNISELLTPTRKKGDKPGSAWRRNGGGDMSNCAVFGKEKETTA